MAMEEQVVDLAMTLGQNNSTNPSANNAQGLVKIENLMYRAEGALVARQGLNNIADERRVRGLVQAGNVVGVADDVNVTALNQPEFQRSVSGAAVTALRSVTTGTPGGNVLSCECAALDVDGTVYLGVVACVDVDADESPSTEVWCWLVLAETGQILVESRCSDVSNRESFYPRIVPTTDGFYMTWIQSTDFGTARFLMWRKLTLDGNLSGASPVLSISDLRAAAPVGAANQAQPYDVVTLGGSHLFIAYVADATGFITYRSIDASGVAGAATSGAHATRAAASPVGMTLMDIGSGSPGVSVVYMDAAGSVWIANFTLPGTFLGEYEVFAGNLPDALRVTVSALDPAGSPAVALVVVHDTGGMATAVVQQVVAGTSGTVLAIRVDQGIGFVTHLHAFTRLGLFSLHAAENGYRGVVEARLAPVDNVGTVLAIRRPIPLSWWTVDESPVVVQQGLPANGTPRPAVIGSKHYGVFPVDLEAAGEDQQVLLGDGLAQIRRWRLVEIDLADRSPIASTQISGAAYIAGGLPQLFDGYSNLEAGFVFAPAKPTVIPNTGTSLDPGVYSYVTVFETVDNNGRITVSPPSGPTQITIVDGTDGTPDVTVPSYPYVTQLQSLYPANISGGSLQPARHLRIKVYRTAKNRSDYHLLRSFTPNINESPGDEGVTFADTTIDAHCQDNELLYTTAALPSEPPPPMGHVCTHRNRMFGIDTLREQVVFSSEVLPPLAPQWNVERAIRVDNDYGPPTAVASLDDKLLIFQASQILVVSGEGPDATGATGSFTQPERVATGIGVDARDVTSVVTTPAGVMFLHKSGIYVVGRDLQISPIGEPVRDLTIGPNAPFARISAGRYYPELRQVWFTPGQLTDSLVLVFDAHFGRWLVFTLPLAGGESPHYPRGLATDVEGYPVVAMQCDEPVAPGRILRWVDDGICDFIDSVPDEGPVYTISTPWFRAAGQGGMQRLRDVALTFDQGEPDATNVTLRIETKNEARPTKSTTIPDATFTWAATGALAGLVDSPLTVNAHVTKQRCSAARVHVILSRAPDKFEEGLKLVNIRMYYGILFQMGKGPVHPTVT
jgi:hypothetical protein